jgi:hypothetical protein
MAGTGNGRFGGFGVPDLGSVPELVVLSTPAEAHNQGLSAAGGGSGHRADFGRAAGHLRVSTHSRLTPSGRDSDQPQDRVAYSSPEGLAFLHAEPFGEGPSAARGASERAGSESEMGLRPYGHKGLERGERASGGYHRLRRPHGAVLAVRPADALGGIARDGSGGGVWTVRSRERKSPKHRVPIRQRAGIRLSETPKGSSGLRDGGMPDAPQKPRIQRAGRGPPAAGFKRDYVYQGELESLEAVAQILPEWIKDYNEIAPHSALGMKSPVQFYADWMSKISTTPVQI